MMISPRLLLVACTFAFALPSVASAGLFGCHSDASCAAPCGEFYCEPTCAAPCGDVCDPTCAAPVCGDVCGGSSYCPPQESCCKRFVRKLWDMEQRKNAFLLSLLPCHKDECAPAYGCECAPTCAAPCGDVYAPSCAAPCGDVCAPACAAPVYYTPSCGAPAAYGCNH